jgi:hypothetical protein
VFTTANNLINLYQYLVQFMPHRNKKRFTELFDPLVEVLVKNVGYKVQSTYIILISSDVCV